MAAMPVAECNGIDLCHETFGDPADPTVLLVIGLGSQMIHWDVDLCGAIAGRGFHVVRFDNRDTGESSRVDAPVDIPGVMSARRAGQTPEVPYLLGDMAADAVGLLDHLGVDRAHVAGMSMGGMIAQTVAIDHPGRVLSLTSIMSTTGDPDVGRPTREAMAALLAPPPRTREEYQEAVVRDAGVWGSPGLVDADRLRRVAGAAWDRGVDAAGTARQLAAIFASGSRTRALAGVTAPTLVIHGSADTLIDVSGGARTAEAVPGAELVVVEGMGHDLAPPLWPRLVDAMTTHAATATT